VSLVGRLYQRFRHLIHEFAKFGIVGGIGFLVTEGVFNLLIHENASTFIANAVATMVAAAVTFVGNRHWTFRHRERTGMGRETAVFFALNAVGVGIQQACLLLAQAEFGRHDKLTLNVAFLVGVGLATMFRFWSYRKFVWLAQSAGPAGPAEVVAVSPRSPLPGGYEARQPVLVPPEPMSRPAPGRDGAERNGQGRNGQGRNGQVRNGQVQPGRARSSGPRHARPR
jgi:putative flippase GtrA